MKVNVRVVFNPLDSGNLMAALVNLHISSVFDSFLLFSGSDLHSLALKVA